MNTQPASGGDIARLLSYWRILDSAREVTALFGDDYTAFVSFFAKAYKAAGGRGEVFEKYLDGIPEGLPSGWMMEGKVVTDAMYLAREVRKEATWRYNVITPGRLPAFGYLLASTINDKEHTHPSYTALWTRLCFADPGFLDAALDGLHVSPLVLNAASWLGSDHAVPAHYARNILGGTVSIERAERGTVSMRTHYPFESVALLHKNGVPWEYANAFSLAMVSGSEPFTGRPPADPVILFWQGSVPVPYAAAMYMAGVQVSDTVEAYENGLALEYALATYAGL